MRFWRVVVGQKGLFALIAPVNGVQERQMSTGISAIVALGPLAY